MAHCARPIWSSRWDTAEPGRHGDGSRPAISIRGARRIVQVDFVAEHLGRAIPVTDGIVSDAGEFLDCAAARSSASTETPVDSRRQCLEGLRSASAAAGEDKNADRPHRAGNAPTTRHNHGSAQRTPRRPSPCRARRRQQPNLRLPRPAHAATRPPAHVWRAVGDGLGSGGRPSRGAAATRRPGHQHRRRRRACRCRSAAWRLRPSTGWRSPSS